MGEDAMGFVRVALVVAVGVLVAAVCAEGRLARLLVVLMGERRRQSRLTLLRGEDEPLGTDDVPSPSDAPDSSEDFALAGRGNRAA